MKLFLIGLALFATLGLSGCTTFLMKDCERQGESQYYHCKQARTVFRN